VYRNSARRAIPPVMTPLMTRLRGIRPCRPRPGEGIPAPARSTPIRPPAPER
jgi:hypothetical protein